MLDIYLHHTKEYIGIMPTLLDKAIEETRKLPAKEQEFVAQVMLDEIHDERAWKQRFSATISELDKLAEQALEADRHGKTTPAKFPPSS